MTFTCSGSARNSLHHALIEIENHIETLTKPQPSDEIATIQRELMPLVVEAKYHFQHAFLIDDAHFDDFNTQALSLDAYISEQQMSTVTQPIQGDLFLKPNISNEWRKLKRGG